MKTAEEAVAEFWEEERKYKILIKKYKGNQEALWDADWMYQEGVRVDEIARTLKKEWSAKGRKSDLEISN